MCATKAAGEGAQVLDATVAELGNVQLDRALRAFMGADVEKSGDIDVWEFGRALASLAAEIPTAAPSREARDALFAQVDLDSSGSVNWGEFLMAWPTILQTATHTMGGGGGAADGPPSGARGGGSGGTPRRTSVGGATVGATVDAPLDVASRVQLQRTVRALEEVLPKATSLRELGNARPLLALVHSMGEEGLVKTAELFKEFARGDRDDGLLDADEVKELAAALADEEGVTFQEMLRGLTTSPRVVAAREATLGNRRRGSKRVEVEARGGRLDFVRFARRLEEVCRRHQPGQTVDFEGYEQVAIRVALDEGHTAIAEDESGEAAAERRRALALMRTYDPQLHGFLGAAQWRQAAAVVCEEKGWQHSAVQLDRTFWKAAEGKERLDVTAVIRALAHLEEHQSRQHDDVLKRNEGEKTSDWLRAAAGGGRAGAGARARQGREARPPRAAARRRVAPRLFRPGGRRRGGGRRQGAQPLPDPRVGRGLIGRPAPSEVGVQQSGAAARRGEPAGDPDVWRAPHRQARAALRTLPQV